MDQYYPTALIIHRIITLSVNINLYYRILTIVQITNTSLRYVIRCLLYVLMQYRKSYS